MRGAQVVTSHEITQKLHNPLLRCPWCKILDWNCNPQASSVAACTPDAHGCMSPERIVHEEKA